MRISQVIDLARRKAKANATTFSDRDMLLYMKAKLPIFQTEIEKVNEEHMGTMETRDLRATGDGTYEFEGSTYLSREYSLPVNLIPRIKFIQAKLDGVNWLRLVHHNLDDYKIPIKEDYIKELFSNNIGIAGYDIFRGSIILLTGEIEEDIIGGLEIWAYAYTDIPDITITPLSDEDVDLEVYGIPDNMHDLFATALCMEWKQNLESPVPLSMDEQAFPILFEKQIRNLRKMNRDRDLIFKRPADNYGDGYNL